jgi:hypothetical protein
MKNTAILLLSLACAFKSILAQAAPETAPAPTKIGSIPPGILVEMKMTAPLQSDSTTKSQRETSSIFIYKTANSRIAIRQWPFGRTTYDVTVAGWHFYTEPTAPEKYKDYVQAVPIQPGESAAPDFPEISFSMSSATVESTKISGRPAWVITGPTPKLQYTDAYIKNLESQLAGSPERQEIMTNIRAAQKAEAARGPGKPDYIWLDAETQLPIRASCGGVDINYSYKPISTPPSLPGFLLSEVAKKIGKRQVW